MVFCPCDFSNHKHLIGTMALMISKRNRKILHHDGFTHVFDKFSANGQIRFSGEVEEKILIVQPPVVSDRWSTIGLR